MELSKGFGTSGSGLNWELVQTITIPDGWLHSSYFDVNIDFGKYSMVKILPCITLSMAYTCLLTFEGNALSGVQYGDITSGVSRTGLNFQTSGNSSESNYYKNIPNAEILLFVNYSGESYINAVCIEYASISVTKSCGLSKQGCYNNIQKIRISLDDETRNSIGSYVQIYGLK